jgi:hypothetical protein
MNRTRLGRIDENGHTRFENDGVVRCIRATPNEDQHRRGANQQSGYLASLAGHELFRSNIAAESVILSLTATGSSMREKPDETA